MQFRIGHSHSLFLFTESAIYVSSHFVFVGHMLSGQAGHVGKPALMESNHIGAVENLVREWYVDSSTFTVPIKSTLSSTGMRAG